MNNVLIWIAIGVIVMLLVIGTGCMMFGSSRDIPAVKNFNAARFTGVWHEIARLPQSFEKGLVNVTATYELAEGTYNITRIS